MLSAGSNNSFDGWDLLKRYVARAEMTIEQHKQDIETVSYMNNKRADLQSRAEKLRTTINRCTNIYKDVQENLVEKKRTALAEYEAAVKESGDIVADSDVSDMRLYIDGKRAVIVNSQGHDLNEREGSADRSTVGLLMRYISLVKQPTYALPMMLFDESFFTLSQNTCEEMRAYLEEISKHMLIIAIEQKDSLFNDIQDKVVYTFVKGEDKKTKIRKEE